MNLTVLLDRKLQKIAEYLRPHYAIHSLSNLGNINNNVALPEVTVSVINNFINDR